jgi:hypothetical protein
VKQSLWLTVAGLCVASVSWLEGKPIPKGFVEQTLEPTGGKVNKPRGWYYAENHTQENGAFHFNWTLSKEKPRDGRYDTGLRIQYFMGVRKATGKSPKQFILEFLERRRKEEKVIPRDCTPHPDGFFTRMCLETEQGPYRILYSVWWDNVGDDAGVVIGGAKKEEWEKWVPVFDQMREVTVLDLEYMKRKVQAEKRQQPKKK